MLEPLHVRTAGSELVWWRRDQVHGEGKTDRPVKTSLSVARVLDVAEKSVYPNFYPHLVTGHSLDGIGERFTIPNRPAG